MTSRMHLDGVALGFELAASSTNYHCGHGTHRAVLRWHHDSQFDRARLDRMHGIGQYLTIEPAQEGSGRVPKQARAHSPYPLGVLSLARKEPTGLPSDQLHSSRLAPHPPPGYRSSGRKISPFGCVPLSAQGSSEMNALRFRWLPASFSRKTSSNVTRCRAHEPGSSRCC